MITPLRSLSILAVLSVANLVSAQTATSTRTNLDAVSLIIPVACVADCTPWQNAYALCPAPAGTLATTYETCVCAPTFLSASQTCFTCMTTELTANTDAQAAVPATALADLQGYCSGVTVSTSLTSSLTTSSTTTSSTTTTTTTPRVRTTSSTTTTPPPAGVSTSAFSEAGESSTGFMSENVTLVSTVQGQAFPTQTKQANVFSAGSREVQVGIGAVAGLAMAMAIMA